MKSCILISHMPNPRFIKRIEAIKTISDVLLICVKREKTSLWDSYDPVDIQYKIIDMDIPTSKHIFRRFIASEIFSNQAVGLIKKYKPDIIYMEGVDCLLIGGKYKKRNKKVKLYYEIGDLRAGIHDKYAPISSKLTNAVITYIEKRRLKYVYKIVVTSKKFYTYYYKKYFTENKCIYIPNIPDLSVFNKFERKKTGKFTIGFIGAIRYMAQMKMLIDATEGLDVQVFFAGGGHDTNAEIELKEYSKGRSDVELLGSYDYKTEINSLYSKADCIFSVYDVKGQNARIALPNKLYESVICGLPIIVAKDTYLGELVEQWECGVSVVYDNTEDLRRAIIKLKNDEYYYNHIVKKCFDKSRELNLLDYLKILTDDIKNVGGLNIEE